MTMPWVPFDDRGLAYGDGLFETVLLREGQPVLWSYHQARLASGCQRLGIPMPADSALADTWKTPAEAPLEVLKVIVTRGSGGRGYALPDQVAPRLLSRRAPFAASPERWQQGVRVRLCQLRLGHQPQLAGIKHLNRLENVLARREWRASAIAEGLLLDHSDNVIEATSMNLFWQSGQALFTPFVDGCGVAGTLRAALLELGHVRESKLPVSVLSSVERLWVGNSVQGVWPVHRLDDPQGSILRTWPEVQGPDPLQWVAHPLLGYPA
ncbi:aminodeoxychorismate lyase [Vreelandella venusta]|nr:aminodeoxychorismate lyase [Halomonas hydrothermalis]